MSAWAEKRRAEAAKHSLAPISHISPSSFVVCDWLVNMMENVPTMPDYIISSDQSMTSDNAEHDSYSTQHRPKAHHYRVQTLSGQQSKSMVAAHVNPTWLTRDSAMAAHPNVLTAVAETSCAGMKIVKMAAGKL